MIAAKFIVSGKVQGVWFRASAREQAVRLGLRGSANNLVDGSVEVIAIGSAEAVDELERWLWRGPPLAEVTSVGREDIATPTASAGFTIG
ncbi:acylphosphatase [Arenimonas sp.]|uniref:acylphosphatase n=1 Tax=Arenimonas sp. TaxID=1872635 RepID=UPI0039E58F56